MSEIKYVGYSPSNRVSFIG